MGATPIFGGARQFLAVLHIMISIFKLNRNHPVVPSLISLHSLLHIPPLQATADSAWTFGFCTVVVNEEGRHRKMRTYMIHTSYLLFLPLYAMATEHSQMSNTCPQAVLHCFLVLPACPTFLLVSI